MDKRTFLKSVFLGAAGIFTLGGSSLKANRKKWDGIFRLPELNYSFDSLEPFVDGETMKLHYTQHHAAYTDKLNEAMVEKGLRGKNMHQILKQVSRYPDVIRNNGGGYINHRLFWKVIGPPAGKKPSAELTSAIDRDLGSFQEFQHTFELAAGSVFGSGWAWLVLDQNNKLKVTSTLNQDNPMMDVAEVQGTPLLCLDVWEHAYYMKNQNRRAEYIDAFWNVVDWDYVSTRYSRIKKARHA